MKTKYFVMLGIFGLLISGFFLTGIFNNSSEDEKVVVEENLYQGPVPEGYDEQYFRETGITREAVN